MTVNEFISKWNVRFASNDTFDISAADLREFKDDTALLIQAGGTSGAPLAELVLPMPVTAGTWYITTAGIWEARGSFNASAPPQPGPNWRRVADFRPAITAASITDATAAGRSMLTATSATVQLALVDKLDIPAGKYGDNPAFTRAYTTAGAIEYLFQRQMQLAATIPAAVTAPAAPTAGQVDDTADTFSFLPNPAYASFASYKVNGLPGVTGAVMLDATNSYVAGSRIYIKVVGVVAKGGLAVYVAGSGNVPDGKVLTNTDPFTGTGTSPTPSEALVILDAQGDDAVTISLVTAS